jgi:hypothetical protein
MRFGRELVVILTALALFAVPGFALAKEAAQQWEIINPEGIVKQVASLSLVPHPASLEGKTVALRGNGKNNSDVFLERIAELLTAKVKGIKVIKLWEAIPESFNYPMKPETAKKIAALKPDLVIGSQAD